MKVNTANGYTRHASNFIYPEKHTLSGSTVFPRQLAVNFVQIVLSPERSAVNFVRSAILPGRLVINPVRSAAAPERLAAARERLAVPTLRSAVFFVRTELNFMQLAVSPWRLVFRNLLLVWGKNTRICSFIVGLHFGIGRKFPGEYS